ncbi:MAG: hypothetical protein OER85_08790 [Gammaproteobacteria bacterium]|nr:hypothetical protein [Gammaproteobacteria bacterium]
MTAKTRYLLVGVFYMVFALSSALTSGCASDSYAAKGAGEGAATGAVAGAVGGMVSALVFGGDVAEAGARGAVYGGTTGAVVGGIAGSKADKAVAEQERAQRDAELAELKNQIGTDAFNGVVALADCKHDLAIANAREAVKSGNSNYALAGVWVETLTEADRQREPQARALFPEIVRRDRDIKSEADAEAQMNTSLRELGNIRVEYGMAAVCSA